MAVNFDRGSGLKADIPRRREIAVISLAQTALGQVRGVGLAAG